MAVRVAVSIAYEKSLISTPAILNGYETKIPEILIPTKLLKLNQIKKTNPIPYKTAGGTTIYYLLCKSKVKCMDKGIKRNTC